MVKVDLGANVPFYYRTALKSGKPPVTLKIAHSAEHDEYF
jgi:hypothetical protein